jgi:hypothetical protein
LVYFIFMFFKSRLIPPTLFFFGGGGYHPERVQAGIYCYFVLCWLLFLYWFVFYLSIILCGGVVQLSGFAPSIQ